MVPEPHLQAGTSMNDTFRFALMGSDDAPIVILRGNLDHSADPAVVDLLRRVARSAAPGQWTVDAAQLGFVDSTAIQLLVDLARLVGPDVPLKVLATPMLARLIEVVCVPGHLTVEVATPDRDEAVLV
jgi:anti-anti-sigma factor